MDRKQEFIATWEREGVEAVRLRLLTVTTWYGDPKSWAIEWVAAKDQERLERNESSISEQILLARKANQIARQARLAAIAAVIATIIGTIAAIVTTLLLH